MKTISKIEVQKYNKDRYSLFEEDNYLLSVSKDVLIKYGLHKGMEIEEDFLKDILLEDEKTKARNVALRYLGHRMRCEREVKEKLIEKGFDDYVEYVLSYLKDNGYLDDLEFAINFSKDKKNLNGFGKIRVKNELQRKGILNEFIEKAIAEVFDEEDEKAVIRELALKKLNTSYKNDSKENKHRKTLNYLLRKGYSYDSASEILKEVL